jgi:Holliday junction resolvase RusA-like endonuclease
MIFLDIAEDEFPGKLLNVNSQRGQSRYFGRLVEPWRQLGRHRALQLDVKALVPVSIWAYFRFTNNRRRDTGNLYPTVKALVDGFVDAGLLPDDCDGIVDGPHLTRHYPNGPPRISISIRSLTGTEEAQIGP